MSSQVLYASIHVKFIFKNIICTCHQFFSMQAKQLP